MLPDSTGGAPQIVDRSGVAKARAVADNAQARSTIPPHERIHQDDILDKLLESA